MARKKSRRSVSEPSVGGKVAKTNSEKCREYREERKNNMEYREAERIRKRLYRSSLSEEKKAHCRELARLRMQRLRNKKKMSGAPKEEKRQKTQPKTRQLKEEERKKWREAKQKYRANMSAQKKRRVREKDRQRHQKKTAKRQDKTTKKGTESFPTNAAERKAISRIKQKMPTDPMKFTVVINGLVRNATPKKRKALSESGVILTPSKKRKLCFLENTVAGFKEVYQKLKVSRRNKDRKLRRIMASHVARLRKYRQLKRVSSELGIRWKSMIRWSKLDYSLKREKRKDALGPEEVNTIQEFYLKPEISVVHAGKKTVLKRLNAQRHTMRRSLAASYKLYKNENPSSTVSLSKFVKLRPKHVCTQKNNKLSSCLCEKCINVEMMVKALKNKNVSDKYEAASRSLCPCPEGEMPDIKCAKRNCTKCGTKLLESFLQNEMESTDDVTWYEWKSQKVELPKLGETKSKKVLVEHKGQMRDLLKNFLEAIDPFSYHLFCSSWQHKQYTHLKSNLQKGQILSVLDFAENYTTSYQDECQSAHWAKKQITIHPVVNYYIKASNNDEENTCTKTFEQVFVSDDVKHDYHFVHKVIHNSLEQLKSETEVQRVIQFTDGCSGQYKSKVPFMDVSCGEEDFGVKFERNYFGSGHGKGPADGCSGVVKSSITRAVKGRTAVVRNATEFYNYCQNHLTKDTEKFKRSFYFIPSEDINRDRKDRTSATTVQGTRNIHSVRAVRSGEIAVRCLSCFCSSCMNVNEDSCSNKGVVDKWKLKSINRQTGAATMVVQETESHDPFLSGTTGSPNQMDGLLEALDYTYLDSVENFAEPSTLDDAIRILVEATETGDILTADAFGDVAATTTSMDMSPDKSEFDRSMSSSSVATATSTDVFGDVATATSTDVFGDVAATTSTDVFGDVAATTSTDASGDVAATTSTDASGDVAATTSTDASGDVAATTSTDASGDVAATTSTDAIRDFVATNTSPSKLEFERSRGLTVIWTQFSCRTWRKPRRVGLWRTDGHRHLTGAVNRWKTSSEFFQSRTCCRVLAATEINTLSSVNSCGSGRTLRKVHFLQPL